MRKLSSFLSQSVDKTNPTGYNFHILQIQEDGGYCKSYHLDIENENQLSKFYEAVYSYFVETEGDPRIFVNARHNRSVTELFKFFLDVDFDKSDKNFSKRFRHIDKLFVEIQRVVADVYGESAAEEMIVWGRDMDATKLLKFHIHFPQIITDSSIGPDAAEYIRQSLQEVPGFSREEIFKAIDIQPLRSGQIRIPLVRKVKHETTGDKTLFSLQPQSEYFLYDNKSYEPIYPSNDSAVASGKYIAALIKSSIIVFNDNIPTTPSQLINAYRNEKYVNEENLETTHLANNELINSILDHLRVKNIIVNHRDMDGRIIRFDSYGPHPCPVNPKIVHERENLYCTIKPDGVYVHCYKKECNNGHGVRIIDQTFEIPVEDYEYSPSGLNDYVKRYGFRGGIDYLNKFWATYEGMEGGAIEFYYRKSDPHTVSAFNTFTRGYGNLLSCDVEIAAPTQSDETRTKKVNIGQLWQRDANRKYIKEIVFEDTAKYDARPEYEKKHTFNAFVGFDTPVEQLREYYEAHRRSDKYNDDVFWFKRHIKHFWCSGETDAVYEWALGWLAFSLRNPIDLPASSLCLVGDLGTFKTKMFEAFWKPFFKKYYILFNDENVITQWTMSLRYKLFAVWDEALVVNDITVNRLKAAITGETLFGNQKFVSQQEFINTMSLVVITNDANKFRVDANSRRYTFLNTRNLFTRGDFKEFSNGHKNIEECPEELRPIINMDEKEYFTHMAEELYWKNIISYLLFEFQMPTNFNTRKVVSTTTLFELKIASQSILVQFLYEMTQSASIYESMENVVPGDDAIKGPPGITFAYRVPAEELASVIGNAIAYPGKRTASIGIFRNIISASSLKCVLYVEKPSEIGETETYFYFTNRDGIVEDLARMLSASKSEFK